MEDFRKYIAQMEPRLPQLFNVLPKTAVTVEPIRLSKLPLRRITRPGRPMESVLAACPLQYPTPLIAALSMTKRSRITRANLQVWRTFHDEILSAGALPLDVLDGEIKRWLKEQVSANLSN